MPLTSHTMTSPREPISRRHFLKTAAVAAAGAVAAPYIVPTSALGLDGATAPSNRVIYGYIGCGGHSYWNFAQIYRCPDAQIIAVCDVDQERLAKAKTRITDNQSRLFGKDYKGCTAHSDFREVINRNDIDAVGIATPDHWHVIPAIMAAKAGKDVIGEKPLSLTVAEGRILSDVMRQTGRIFQTASENRSIDSYIRLVELVRGGVVGQLKHVEVRLPIGNSAARVTLGAKEMSTRRSPEEPPKTLNYEMWLGQAPLVPYIPARLHGNFRWNSAFSGGVICDWGAHMIDLAQWAHDSEQSGPVAVEGRGDFPPPDAVYNNAATFEVHYQYADGVTMTVSAGKGDLDPDKSYPVPVVGRTEYPGIRFEGTEGWIESHKWRGSLKASRRAMLDAVIDREKVRLYRPSEIVARADAEKGGEHRNFIDCVRSRTPCYAPAETGHRTITIAHIGNIAMLLGRKLRWNPEAERFVNDPEADRMLSRHQRSPWTIANIDSWIRKNS
jgi:predicted dehydrogenase